jgi:hypothetical protein
MIAYPLTILLSLVPIRSKGNADDRRVAPFTTITIYAVIACYYVPLTMIEGSITYTPAALGRCRSLPYTEIVPAGYYDIVLNICTGILVFNGFPISIFP